MRVDSPVIIEKPKLSFIVKNVHVMSENEVRTAHWGKLGRLKKKYRKALATVYDEMDDPGQKVWDWFSESEQKRKVRLVSVRPRLIEDDDNLVGGFKPFVDALRYVSLIVDDKRMWVEIEYDQRQSPPLPPLPKSEKGKGGRRKRMESVEVYIEDW